MIAPALPSRRLNGWRTAVFAVLACASLPAAAQSLLCGTFKADDTGTTITLESPNQGVRQIPGMAPEPYLVHRLGNELKMADLDSGGISTLTLSEGGRHLSDGVNEYTLVTPATCRPVTVFAPNTCRAEIASCMTDMTFASNDKLRQWCDEDVPAACSRLLGNYDSEARAAARAAPPADEDPDLAEPDVCKPNSGKYDEAACQQAAGEAMAKAMAKALMGALGNSVAAPLPAAQLDEITGLCRAQRTGTFCTKAAAALWDAGRLADARDALQRACSRGKDPRACEQAAPLASLSARELVTVPVTVLPCGTYTAERGLIDQLAFGDGGLVDTGLGGGLRARLEAGDVRVRHDKGGDFVFQRLANGDLVGSDSWNQYSRYRRSGGPTQCAPPVVFVETRLPLDCPAAGTAQGARDCCDAGKLQGCNAAGHHLALGERWADAAPYYLKLCTAGVREGCENLATVYQHTGDDAIPASIQQLCERDGKGTHVACDVHATRNWEALKLGADLEGLAERLATEAEAAEDDADADADSDTAPPSARRNRKGD